MSNSKKIIGIMLVVLSITALITWEKWGKFKFVYDEVAVFKTDVERGTLISKDMFGTIHWPKKDKEALSINDVSKMEGKIATQNIKKEIPLYEGYFGESESYASGNEDSYVMQIPSDWIEACPKGLKKNSRVYFYNNGAFITSAWVIDGEDEEGDFNIAASKEQILALSKIGQNAGKLVISVDGGF